MTTTYYAAIDPSTLAVHGLGTSASAALHDAERDRADPTTLRAVPCSPAAYVHVTQHGGAPSSLLTVSRTGVCLRSEEE